MEKINWQDVIDKYSEYQQRPALELADNEFTASTLTGCLRQAVKNKLQLTKHDKTTLRHFQVGHMFHKYIQQDCALGCIGRPMEFEKRVVFEHDGIKIFGHVDAYDGENVYDFKTTADIKMSTRLDVHIGYVYQLSVYMHALKAKHAYVVYIAKKNLEIIDKEITPYNKDEIAHFCHRVRNACEIYQKYKRLPDKDKCFVCAKEFSRRKV